MEDKSGLRKEDAELTDEEKRNNVIRLAFGGDRAKFEEFCRILEENIPENTGAVVGGSAVTGHSFKEGAPFDADGPGTSDIDLTLVGPEAIEYFTLEGFWVPGIHSHPIKDDDEEIAPGLKPLRRKLQALAGRPVTIQASQSFYYWMRERWLGQPYLLLAGNLDDKDDEKDDKE